MASDIAVKYAHELLIEVVRKGLMTGTQEVTTPSTERSPELIAGELVVFLDLLVAAYEKQLSP